jgi:small subunit ribosomal protein S3Ae
MTIGKNKRISKGKKGGKKRTSDPFSRKDWYIIKAPAVFSVRQIGKTPVTRTSGNKTSSNALVGRVIEVSLADLQQDEDQAHRKVKLRVDEVQGQTCLTSFWGIDLAREKIRSLFKKWQTTIEAHVDVKIVDGYVLRMFIIGFTKRRPNQKKKTSYAQSSQIYRIRKRMVDITIKETTSCDLKGIIQKLFPEVIGKRIEKSCSGIYPLYECMIRKVKVLRVPKRGLSETIDGIENVI